MSTLENLDLQNIPRHVAFIMDGNGRWAKNKGQHRLFGHAAGVESVKEVIKTARELGVSYLTMLEKLLFVVAPQVPDCSPVPTSSIFKFDE
jgi:undecaprenyl pyrophosphate synthase